MITTSIKLSIEVENGDETEKDGFLNTISHLYHYEFVKENSGYGNKRYLQYLLTPAVHNNCGRKRKLSPEEEEEVIWYEITLNIDYNDLAEDEIKE